MKLQFKNQGFQEAATAAVCDVFEGQPYHDPNVYTVASWTLAPRLGTTDARYHVTYREVASYDDLMDMADPTARIMRGASRRTGR